MKRAERHHLKENDLQRWAIQARGAFEDRKREAMIGAVAVLVIAAAIAGWAGWRGYVESRAQRDLAEALGVQEARVSATGTPAAPGSFPSERARQQAAVAKFKAAADAHPSTDAGIFARYQEAAGQVALGNPAAGPRPQSSRPRGVLSPRPTQKSSLNFRKRRAGWRLKIPPQPQRRIKKSF